ncbi:chemotaxis protein CheA [Desulfococcaceae bacterium HSG8]|nr:chemotaxis protein CheA [Desulfococcaceae bacterium HSG8]
MPDKYKDNFTDQDQASLDDAATLLIQIEPNDVSELTRLHNLLNTIANNFSYSRDSREKVAQAADKIRTDISDPDEVRDMLTKIGRLIEEAMNVAEENEKTENSEPEPSFIPTDADPDLLGAFITESSELITNAEEALLSLEENPEDMEAVGVVFRAFHTVKGTSAFLELSLISELAHHSESFLSRIRDREIRYTGGYTDLALRAVDMLKEIISSVRDALDGMPFYKPQDYNELIRFLAEPEKFGISDASVVGQQTADNGQLTTDNGQQTTDNGQQTTDNGQQTADNGQQTADNDQQTTDNGQQTTDNGQQTADNGQQTTDSGQLTADNGQLTTDNRKPTKQKTVPMTDIAQGIRTPKSGEKRKNIAESSVRVPVERLDRFIDTVGELVVAHSMVTQDEVVSGGRFHELSKKVSQTNKIVRELQNMSMSMRMIPLKATFQKMARLVRDVSRKAGKNVAFSTEGEETEIDRNMVDMINDPLVHMVRNAVDHGLEPSDVRIQNGKPPQGTVKLSAHHSGGNVILEIADDGKGLDRDAILENALERKLISEADKSLGDREVFGLIFEPGFSTAKVVSEISGRGVGMNVVKTNIEELRGQIDIQSVPGEGSVFRISLPLTLAIIDGMVVRVGSERYVMPTVSIVRSVRPDKKDLSTVLRRGETLTLQGKLVPLFRLNTLFRVEGAEQDPTQAIIMVVEHNGKQAGLLVDELIGSQQIVIKTLGETLRNISGISGSAIMPDGRVGLILDVGGLVVLANEA